MIFCKAVCTLKNTFFLVLFFFFKFTQTSLQAVNSPLNLGKSLPFFNYHGFPVPFLSHYLEKGEENSSSPRAEDWHRLGKEKGAGEDGCVVSVVCAFSRGAAHV